MTYLACPYWDDDPEIRQGRYELVTELAGVYEARGVRVFSPITHSHPIEQQSGVHRDHSYWMPIDLKVLSICDQLDVLMLDGWRESEGVSQEIEFAEERGIHITYLDPAHYNLK